MTQDNSKVSIVLCGYNQAQYVEHAIESALSQTHGNIELLIIDNGSTDGSRELLQRYRATPRVHLLLHETNQPLSKRFNEAIGLSTGQFISILPADDYYLPNKLERQLEEFSRLPSDYGVVYAPSYRVNVDTGQQWVDASLKQSGNVLKDMFLRHYSEGFINPISPLVRKECFIRYPYHEDVFVEGESIYLRIALRYKFQYIDEPLTVMREHSTNMGKAIRKNGFVALTMLDKLSCEPEFPPELTPDLVTFRATLMRRLGWLGIRMAADPTWARANFLGAIRLQPTQIFRLRTIAGLALSVFPPAAIRAFNWTLNSVQNHKETVAFKADYH